ncbi:type II toxin-antitoxin system PemK/MazF family toxin [Marinitoga sp. 38H-ov]|uniref:type II toxin-antitoxin system PemK/MazF family toxin n=1 Tax=Marinitoga sp. 38H-ov TaxID=1755814 RepID=UPI0013EBDBC6|nr:type II toxin-antitoxin system PemK/MazF family toxin [Marinitoga sp. 38H-ov]KAF2956259.1 hypothetical protein AS160_00235 [Marinitoga sp. 38H-ov]
MSNNKITIADVKKNIENIVENIKNILNNVNLKNNNLKKINNLFVEFEKHLNKSLEDFSFKYENLPRFKKGDIIYVDFGLILGSEQMGKRPAVVLEKYNSPKAHTLIVAPITTFNGKGTNKNFNGLIKVDDIPELKDNSCINLMHIRAISKLRLRKHKDFGNKYIYSKLKTKHLIELDDALSQIFIGKAEKKSKTKE